MKTKRKKYIYFLMQEIMKQLEQLGTENPTSLDLLLEKASSGVSAAQTALDTATTVLQVAGVAAAIPSAGTSLVAAEAAITLIKTGYNTYKFFKKNLRSQHETFSIPEINAEEKRLALKVYAKKAAYQFAMRYNHFIDDMVTEESLPSFARFAARRILKKINESEQLPTTEELIDYLYQSTNGLFKETVEVEEEYQVKKDGWLRSSFEPFYTKEAYAFSYGISVALSESSPPELTFYEPKENAQKKINQKTDLAKYGYMVLDETTLPAYKQTKKALAYEPSPDERAQMQSLVKIYYPITRQDVQDYLDTIGPMTNRDARVSLNDFLSARFGLPVFAECHDERLKDMDLRHGKFTDVNFESANLEGCLIEHTDWTGSYLDNTHWGHPEIQISLNGAIFNHVSAEKSHWRNILFSDVHFLHAEMSGSHLEACVLGNIQHMGSTWDLVTTDNMDPPIDFLNVLNNLKKEVISLKSAVSEFKEDIDPRVQALEKRLESQWPAPAIGKSRAEQDTTTFDEAKTDLESDSSQTERLKEQRIFQKTVPKEIKNIYIDFKDTFEHPANPLFYQALHFYITPDVLPFSNSPDTERKSVVKRIDEFLDSSDPLLLLHGDVGAGKSSAARLLQKRLWKEWQDETSWIPIVIELKQVRNGAKNFLDEVLKATPYNYNNDQIQWLKKNRPFLIILDGLDECPDASLRHIMIDCRMDEWTNAKVLLTARTEWLHAQDNYRPMLVTHTSTETNQTPECYIAHLTPEQINAYFQKRYAKTALGWEYYRQMLDDDPELSRLIDSPVMLHIVCKVLPTLSTNPTAPKEPRTRNWLYDRFIQLWFNREIIKLRDLTTVHASNEILTERFLDYTRRLGFTMFRTHTLLVERVYATPSKIAQKKSHIDVEQLDSLSDPWPYFFDHSDYDVQQAQHSCPLSLSRFDDDENNTRTHRYQFIHKSFMEHAAAAYLYDILGKPGDLQAWNHRFLVDELGIMAFLKERLEADPKRELKEAHLIELIYSSRNNRDNKIVSSNVVSFLNHTHFDFHQRIPDRDLTFLHLPRVNLIAASGAELNFDGTDLTKGYLYQGIFPGSQFSRTQVESAIFSDHLSFDSELPVTMAVPHPTRSDIIAYAEQNNIVITELANGEIYHRWAGHASAISSVSASFFGQQLSLNAPLVGLRENDYQKPYQTRKVPSSPRLAALAFSPDGNLLATSAWDKTIRIWNPDTETTVVLLTDHKAVARTLFWLSPQLLASGSDDCSIRVWDIAKPADEACVAVLGGDAGHKDWVLSVFWARKNLLISGARDKTVKLWDLSDINQPICITTIEDHTELVRTVALSKNGLLASAGADRIIRVHHTAPASHYTLFKQLEGHTDWVESLAWSRAGLLASGSRDHSVRVWNVDSGTSIITFSGHTNWISSVNWALNEQQLISSSLDRTIRIWDTAHTASLKPGVPFYPGHPQEITHMAFASNGLLATACQDKKIRIWDMLSDKEPRCIAVLEGHTDAINCLIWLEGLDSPMLASSESNAKSIYIWKAPSDSLSFALTKKLREHEYNIMSLAWNPQKKWLFSCSQEGYVIWEISLKIKIIAKLTSRVFAYVANNDVIGSDVNAVSAGSDCILWSEKKDRLAIGCKGGIDFFNYDLSTKKVIYMNNFVGHSEIIKDLAYSQNDEFLASASQGKTIRIWNMATEECVAVLRGHTAHLEKKLVWSPDGRCLISCTSQETLLWGTSDWTKAPYRISMGASALSCHGTSLVLSNKNTIHMIDLTDFPRRLHWVKTIGNPSCLQNADFKAAKGLLPSTQEFIQRESALNVPSGFFVKASRFAMFRNPPPLIADNHELTVEKQHGSAIV